MSEKINGGSPIGPTFVVYEREEGKLGYDLEMAKWSVGKGWHNLLEAIFKYKTPLTALLFWKFSPI